MHLPGIDLYVRTPLLSRTVNLCDQFCPKIVCRWHRQPRRAREHTRHHPCGAAPSSSPSHFKLTHYRLRSFFDAENFSLCRPETVEVVAKRDGKREPAPMRRGLIPWWWKKPRTELLLTFKARGDGSDQANVPRGLPALALRDPSIRLLRMAARADRQAAVLQHVVGAKFARRCPRVARPGHSKREVGRDSLKNSAFTTLVTGLLDRCPTSAEAPRAPTGANRQPPNRASVSPAKSRGRFCDGGTRTPARPACRKL